MESPHKLGKFHIIYLHTLKQTTRVGLEFLGLPGVPSFSPTSRCNAIALIWSCTGGSFVGLRRVRGALDGSWMPEDGWLGSGGGWWVVWVKVCFYRMNVKKLYGFLRYLVWKILQKIPCDIGKKHHHLFFCGWKRRIIEDIEDPPWNRHFLAEIFCWVLLFGRNLPHATLCAALVSHGNVMAWANKQMLKPLKGVNQREHHQ